ncbi:MAG: 50S ribosomal protein L9 [Phycisphaerae bacterium]|nr:50S ribosomal protein L9 [Phycisphaerae bacterium]|tara:strand:- start:7939 stop:8517 length:579 start_codon:yes stop_codon:yes gene_type:complete
MASTKRIELLLTSNVENLGIVGDIVRVRMGYARNYLLPMGIAELPTEEKIEALAEEREIALKEHEANRAEQASIIEKLEGITLTLTRSANDQGGLYGSVTQRDIADALVENGYSVDTRAVRLHSAIRRIGEYHVTIQFGSDMKIDVEITVNSDRALEDREEMEFDDEGNLVMSEGTAKEEVTEEAAEATTDE